MKKNNTYIEKLRKETKCFLGFTILAVLTPIFFVLIPWMPENEVLATRFPRSGALMVVFSLLAEAKAISVHNTLNPSGIVDITFKEAKEEYGKHPGVLNTISFILIAVGTFIWGFGDLLINK